MRGKRKTRISMAALLAAATALGACEAEDTDRGAFASPSSPSENTRRGEAWLPSGGLPQFGARGPYRRELGSWNQSLTPTESGNCRFTEKPRGARPADLIVSAWSGNMDLLTAGEVLMHDHAIGFVEAMWRVPKPVIAARQDLPDLWIEPLGEWDRVVLIIGADEFYCSRWDGRD